ncbi:MAG: hypothetical protein A2062_06570, partial [Omnitrophica WOR_2 bacterium GWA2_44_7]
DTPSEDILHKIKELAVVPLEAMGYEVVALNFSKTKGGLIIRFLVDKAKGGISLFECGKLNKYIGELLDGDAILEGKYSLEVSSPGIDRPLDTEKDFLRARGRRVKFFLHEPIGGKLEIEAVVDKVENSVVFIKQNNQIGKISLTNIKKAKQVIK